MQEQLGLWIKSQEAKQICEELFDKDYMLSILNNQKLIGITII